jgi:hypothetical protein
MRIEELKTSGSDIAKDSDEFLADMFAGNLLMPKTGLLSQLQARGFTPAKIVPLELFTLSSFFGVGYGTLIEHMTWTLNLLSPQQRSVFMKQTPKKIKNIFGIEASSELVISDEFWSNRAIDLEVGDTLLLPSSLCTESNACLIGQGAQDGKMIFRAFKRGYSRTFSKDGSWAANIRIAPKNYVGLAKYRFLEDLDEEVS